MPACLPTRQAGQQLHALCHEHHIEMRTSEDVTGTEYACAKPDCPVRFTPLKGYFIAAKRGQFELDMLPRRRCPRDGQPYKRR